MMAATSSECFVANRWEAGARTMWLAPSWLAIAECWWLQELSRQRVAVTMSAGIDSS